MNYVSTIIGIAPINLVSYVFQYYWNNPSNEFGELCVSYYWNSPSDESGELCIFYYWNSPSDESDDLVRDSKYFSVSNLQF